jgi:hypothetical protein
VGARFALVLAALATAPGSSLDLEEVLAKQERAMGTLRDVRTISLAVRMQEPGRRFDLRIRFAWPGFMRVDLSRFGLSVYSEGFGTRGPWQQHLLQRSPRGTSAAGGDAIVNGVEGFTWGRSLRQMRERGHAVELVQVAAPGSEVGVRVRFRGGSERRYFLHPRTFRIARMEQEYALHPDMQGAAGQLRRIESTWLDYRQTGGLILPMRIVNRDRDSGEIVQSIAVREVRVNEPLDAGIFDSR